MKRMKSWVSYSVLSALLIVSGGCSSNTGGAPSANTGDTGSPQNKVKEVSKEPVTLTVFNSSIASEANFNKIVTDGIKAKYPHITIKMVKKEKGSDLPDLIASGSVPDIIMGDSSGNILQYKEMDLLEDLTPLIKEHRFDLNKLDPVAINDVKLYSGGQMLAFPYGVNMVILYYNKGIFNKFGIPYPKDGMTWEQVGDLAKQLTREENGVQYRGFDFPSHVLLPYNQLSLPVVDSKTLKASVNNDQWKKWFDTMKSMYNSPGAKDPKFGNPYDPFLKDMTLAMFASTSLGSSLPDAEKKGLDWDVVSLPSFKEAPGVTTQMFAPFVGVSKTTKYKDQAFLAIAAMISEEHQMIRAKEGAVTILNDSNIKNAFGSESVLLKDKNKAAFTKSKLAPAPPSVTKYDSIAHNVLRSKLKEVVLNDKDVNTALREAEEQINKDLESAKLK